MAKVQLKDFKDAEKQLTGQEYVYISQEANTRKTTLNGISEFTNKKNYKIISDLTEIGCTAENTIPDIINAMPNKSQLMYVIGSSHKGTKLGLQMPSVYGCLYITRVDLSRTNIEYINADNGSTTISSNRYVAYYNSTLNEVSPWELLITSEKMSNPNLLINGDFRNPVNQRGKTVYSGYKVYTIDRWIVASDTNATVEVLSDCIRFKSINNGSWSNLTTYLEVADIKHLLNKNVTLTLKTKTPTNNVRQLYSSIKGGSYLLGKVMEGYSPTDTFVATFKITDVSNFLEVGCQVKATEGAYIDIEYIKLEVGSQSTPFTPRPVGEELALCQRYYEVLMSPNRDYDYVCFFTNEQNKFNIPIKYRVQKRVNPTINCLSYTGLRYVPRNSSGTYNVSELTGTVTGSGVYDDSCNISIINNSPSVFDSLFTYGATIDTLGHTTTIVADAEIY